MIENAVIYVIIGLIRLGLLLIIGSIFDIPINYNLYIAFIVVIILNQDIKDYGK